MTVGELREKLEGVDVNMRVLIPMTHEFDGVFYSPCSEDSGVSAIGIGDSNEEDIKEMELLNKPIPEEDTFLLIPCGFGDEKDHRHKLN